LHITDNLINFTGVPITATDSVTPTSSFGCVGATEDIVITIAPEPVVAPGQTKTICSGQSADFEILLTPLNMPAGTLLDWPVPVMSDGSAQGSAGSSIAADPAGTLHITDVFMNTTGVPITATYDITPSNGACLGATETVVITIDPGPVVLPGQTTTICSGDPVNMEILLTPANLPAGTTLDWAAPTMSDGSIQGSAGVGVSADPAGTIHITDILINQTGAPITAVYTVTPTNGLCVGGAESIVVTIEPEPVIQPGQVKSICNGDAVNVEILLNPLNTPAGSTFDWPAPTMSAGPPQGTAGVNVAADPAGTLHITDILNNVTSSPITATYSVTATSGSCSGATVDIVITIVPDPTDVGIVEAPAQDICEGVDQTITLATSDNGVDYEILVDGVSSGLPVVTGDGSNNLLIGTLSGLAVGSYTISVTATVGSCMITLSDNVALNVNAVPSSAITGPLVVCENTTETYSAPAGATSYVWTLTGGDGVISSGAGTETIAVDWLTTGGDLAVTVTGPAPTDCSSTTTVIVGVFGVLPQLPDENLDVCQNTAIPTLTTTPIAGATVNWYLIAVDPTNLIGTGASFTPSSTDLDMSVVGTTNFLFTQDIGCGESPAANYAVNVLAAPNAGSSNTVNMCITSAATDLFLALGGTPDAGGIWTDDDSSGALTGSIFDPAVAGDGVFNFTYRVDGAGVCSGEFATAVITAGVASGSNMPTPEQSSYTACTFGSPPTLTVIGANVLWYSDVALTSQIGSGASFIPTDGVDIDMTIQGITSYYATQDEGCGESAGVQVDVLLEGVTADIGTIMNTYPEQDIGSIEVINIDSNNPPFDIQLLDDNGNVIENRTAVGQDFLGNYSFFYDQLSAGTYEVVLEDAAGCQLSITPVVIAFNTDVFIPNVFTPNGDSYNDTFKILNMQPNTKIEISNRWGVRVFSADDYQNDWQAVGLADGVYYYTVDMNGAIFKGNVEVWRGN
jgi:gliding motility-associated-like protein